MSEQTSQNTNGAPIRVGFLLVPGFSMLAFSSAIEPLRLANTQLGRTAYEWRTYSVDQQIVCASNGVLVTPQFGIERDDGWPVALVVCSCSQDVGRAQSLIASYLSELAQRNVMIGGIATAAQILAQSGLLKGYKATIQWEYAAGLLESHPDVELSSCSYEIDGDRMTAAGGAASLDMVLAWLAREHGEALATSISEQLVHDHIRPPGSLHLQSSPTALTLSTPKLAEASKLMSQHLRFPLPPGDIAAQIGLSLRQLERLFQAQSGYTPQRYYLELRLERARQLLLQTGLSILEIATATGFRSQSHFTKCYRERFKMTPTSERRTWLTGKSEMGGSFQFSGEDL